MAKKMNAKRPRNYAAQDATLINVRKLRRELTALAIRVDALELARINEEIAPEPEAPLLEPET